MNSQGESHLTEVFRNLIVTLDSNNQLLHHCMNTIAPLSKKIGQLDDITSEIITRNDKVQVEIKCTFLKIIDIDTLKQTFSAEMFIQAKWQEPALLGKSEQELANFNPKQYWNPQLTIMNLDGDLDMDRSIFSIQMDNERYSYPLVIRFWRFKGVFIESLELEHFPVDVQDLTVQLGTDRSDVEMELVEDQQSLSSVNTKTFLDAQEWTIYNHVETFRGQTTQEYASYTVHPILHIQCRVARKVGFFLWNIVFIMFLIIVLTFATFSIDPASSDRMAVTITLLLTAVAFKLVVKQSLPTISYLTYLDIYVLTALLFLGLQAAQNACMAASSRVMNAPELDSYDKWSMGAMGIILFLFHVIFGIYIYVTAFKRRRIMKNKDKLYKAKKKHLEKYGVLMPTNSISLVSESASSVRSY